MHLLSSYPIPDDADEHPKIRGGKKVRRTSKAPTTMQANNSAFALTLTARIEGVTMVPHPGFGCIVSLISGKEPRVQKYMLSISSFPSCTCPYFEVRGDDLEVFRRTWAVGLLQASVFHLYCRLWPIRRSGAILTCSKF